YVEEQDTATITGSTIVGNTAQTGGGIFVHYGTVTIENALIAENVLNQNTAITSTDIDGSESNMAQTSFSLVQNKNPTIIVDNGNNIFDQDPQIGSLAYNGGPTQTFLPEVTSPVVGVGNPNGASVTDQRGFPRTSSGSIDIGSVQQQLCGDVQEGASCD